MSSHRKTLMPLAIGASLLTHVLLGLVLWYIDSGKVPKRQTAIVEKPIQSYLYVAPSAPMPVPEQIAVPDPAIETPSQVIDTPAIDPAPKKAAGENEPFVEDSMPGTQNNEQPISAPEMPKKPPTAQSSAQSVSRYFSERNRQAVDQLSQQHAQSFRENRNRPELPQPGLALTPDEQLVRDTTTEVDCSSGAKQSMAMLSAIAGGTVRCRQYADINKFIDARIKREPQKPLGK